MGYQGFCIMILQSQQNLNQSDITSWLEILVIHIVTCNFKTIKYNLTIFNIWVYNVQFCIICFTGMKIVRGSAEFRGLSYFTSRNSA